MKCAGILLSALWLVASSARAQAPTAESAQKPPPADTLMVPPRLSKFEAEIGERVHVRVAVPKPTPDAHLVGPMPKDFGTIQVLISKESPAQGDSTAWEMDVAAFDLGAQDLRVIPFRLESGERSIPVALGEATININATLPDTATVAGLREVKPPLPVPIRWRWGRIAMALGLLAALITLIVWLRRRRGTEEVPLIEMPEVSPEDAALRALRELEEAALAARGKRVEHYVRLSGILREYVEKRFRVPAVESTTTELRQVFLQTSRTPADTDRLLELLDSSDLVKFARYDPGLEPARVDLERAREWIERNRPAELPLPQEAVHAAG